MPEESLVETQDIIDCPRQLRDEWRSPDSDLPQRWRRTYPAVFDDDDLKLAQGKQRKINHFSEWFVAIYLFERDGSRSLVEKYDTYEIPSLGHLRRGHQRKVAEYQRVVPPSVRHQLFKICANNKVQLPDLLVIAVDDDGFSFVEVKGPGDGTVNRENQRRSRQAIRDLGVPVEVIAVRLVS